MKSLILLAINFLVEENSHATPLAVVERFFERVAKTYLPTEILLICIKGGSRQLWISYEADKKF